MGCEYHRCASLPGVCPRSSNAQSPHLGGWRRPGAMGPPTPEASDMSGGLPAEEASWALHPAGFQSNRSVAPVRQKTFPSRDDDIHTPNSYRKWGVNITPAVETAPIRGRGRNPRRPTASPGSPPASGSRWPRSCSDPLGRPGAAWPTPGARDRSRSSRPPPGPRCHRVPRRFPLRPRFR